jgi:transglutaminase-like putative cysteine protease
VRRRALAAGILLLWLSVLGWHVRREYFVPVSARLLERARSLAPGTFFYTIRMNGQAIGFSYTQLDTLRSGFVVRDRVILDVPAQAQTHRALVQTEIFLDPVLQLQSFRFELGSEIGAFKLSGQRRDSVLELQLRTGDNDAQTSNLTIDPAVLLDAAVPMRVAAGGQLKIGEAVSTAVFNPSTMSSQRLELRVTAHDTLIVTDSARYDAARLQWLASSTDTIPVWRLEQSLGGITVASWVDEDGHLVKAESPLGYTLERTAFELADQDWKRSLGDASLTRGYGAVIERTAIAAHQDLANPGAADSLRVRMTGIELRGFDLAGGRQQLRADTLIITREPGAQLRASYALPFRGAGEPARELGSTPLIQAEHPDIVRTARRIAAGNSDPVQVAQRLNDWIYRQLEKNVTLSVPSAEQVLRAREGDCNEHTVLYLALARALGLPARSAAGLVHLRGRFYYHAWPEVWLQDRWVAVDPTLGQFPADATHLRFITGGLARQIELIRLIGRLQLEVV